MLKETSKIEVATATLKAYMADGHITTPNS
jgi:hypothetical protein